MDKTRKGVWVVLLLIVVLAIGAYAVRNHGGSGSGPITIGFIAPLTGDAANLGQDDKTAVSIAVDEINGAGGVNGRKISMVYEDGQCNSVPASNAANKLMNVDKVPVILGGLCSGETSAIAPAAKAANVVILSPCSSAPALSTAGIFRDYPSDAYQGNYAAHYAYETLAKKKAAVMYVKTDYGQGIKQVFEDSFKQLGGSIVDEEGFDRNVADLRTQLTKVKAAQPDIIYFISYTDEAIVGVKQAAALGIKAQLFGGDAWSDPKIWQTVGVAGSGAMYTEAAAAHADVFAQKFKAKTGSDQVTVCAPFAYDAMNILAAALKTAGTDPTAIREALFKTNYTGGVTADKISFDANGDLVGANYKVSKVENGKAVQVK